MNLEYWGIKLPASGFNDDPARALPVVSFGPAALQDAGGAEVIAIAHTAIDTLTVPDDAVYAKLQNNGAIMWYNTTGTDPVIATGNAFEVADGTIIELWGKEALDNFKCLAHTGATGNVYVEYKKYKKDIVT